VEAKRGDGVEYVDCIGVICSGSSAFDVLWNGMGLWWKTGICIVAHMLNTYLYI
jgi:hypothetical protein